MKDYNLKTINEITNYLVKNNFIINENLPTLKETEVKISLVTLKVIEINLDNIDCTRIDISYKKFKERIVQMSIWLIELIKHFYIDEGQLFLFSVFNNSFGAKIGVLLNPKVKYEKYNIFSLESGNRLISIEEIKL